MTALRIQITSEQIGRFEAALKQWDAFEAAFKQWDAFGRMKALECGIDPVIANAQRSALLSQLDDLREQLVDLQNSTSE